MNRQEKFIEKATKKHGGKYSYHHVNYIDAKTNVSITCPIHGDFLQTPDKHLQGHGCKLCAAESASKRMKMSTEEFIKKAITVHGDVYDYSKTDLEKRDENGRVIITCRVHGDFLQTPSSHLAGCGCKMCSAIKEKKYTTETFIEEARKIHGDKYDYSKVIYDGCDKNVIIICPKHGEFSIRAGNLLYGIGCKKCGVEKRSEERFSSKEEFIKKAKDVHGDKYDYSKVEYVDSKTKVCIICPDHGEFWQTPNDHISNGHGCRKCGNNLSKGENEIYSFLKSCNINVIQGDRKILDGKEIDIFLPDYNIGIETIECNKKGVRLIQIFEDEWLFKKEIVKKKIKHILGINNEESVYARKCKVSEIDKKLAYEFLDKNHIQGHVDSSVAFGAFYNSNLVGVMTFTRDSDKCWVLTRFASDNNKKCVGIAGKLFKLFVRMYSPIKVKSFADRRWTLSEKDNLYTSIGFELADVTKPDYRYVNGQKREHKFGYRKNILHRKYGVPLELTEHEMTKKLGFYRIYDCGLFKYEWKIKGG